MRYTPMRTPVFLLSVTLMTVGFSGCMSGDSGTVGMAVTDAPADDWAKVEVTFSRGAVHQSGSADPNVTSGWKEIVNTTKAVDLIALHQNDTSQALGFAELTAGHYQQIRLFVDSVKGTKKADGMVVTFKVPSGVLKTAKSFEVKAGGNTTLTLEIDLAKSINCKPGLTDCTFAPKLGQVTATEKS